MDGEEKPRVIMATPTGYCYSDAENPQVYNLTAAMEIIGFPPKNLINSYQPISDLPSNQEPIMLSQLSWNNHHHEQQQNNSLVLDDDPSLRCVFGDGNEKQSQGSLSLSLTSSNLQPFNKNSRFGQPSSVSDHHPMMLQQFQIRDSKYLEPAMELLNQICNLGLPESKKAKQKRDQSEVGDDRTEPLPPPAFALDFLELQRRKDKLFQMLQEVEGRYKHYCDQMKAVVSSFEAVVGGGAAAAYSTMAARAMSRHFRCLKDGIVGQIKATNKATGEKDCAIPGATKGETPRLRILDVKLRQQRAFQQMGVAESHPWRPQRGLPEKAVAVLRAWLFEHFLHPYPSEVDKRILARQTGLSRSQVSNWFINARVRLWKPMVEEMYMEDQKEEEPPSGGAATSSANLDTNNGGNPTTNEDRKPTQDQLMIRTDSECFSSIINTPKNNAAPAHSGGYGRGGDEMGAMQFDFSSYGGGGGGILYLPDASVPSNYGGGGGGGGGVSLTLGLQQHGGGGGVSSIFFGRDGIEDSQTGDYSIFESENQNLQYRNLMSSQLLDDLAG